MNSRNVNKTAAPISYLLNYFLKTTGKIILLARSIMVVLEGSVCSYPSCHSKSYFWGPRVLFAPRSLHTIPYKVGSTIINTSSGIWNAAGHIWFNCGHMTAFLLNKSGYVIVLASRFLCLLRSGCWSHSQT